MPPYNLGTCNPDPFPHFVVKNWLPQGLYDALSAEFPEGILLARDLGENQRADVHARDMGCLTPAWQEFVLEHTSTAFARAVLDALGAEIDGDWEASPRRCGYGFLQTECQPGINTPTSERSRVRGPHVDNPIQLYGGMLYMGEGEGDLILYKRTGPAKWYGKLELEDDCVEEVARVKYEPNTLVMFLNSPRSIHGVSPRGPTEECRRLCNFIGEVPRPLFRIGHGPY